MAWTLAAALVSLVEKKRAPGGEFEATRLLLVRSGEGAPFMAEELRLDEQSDSTVDPVHSLQIWVLPDARDHSLAAMPWMMHDPRT